MKFNGLHNKTVVINTNRTNCIDLTHEILDYDVMIQYRNEGGLDRNNSNSIL